MSMYAREKNPNRRACRLVALCTDSHNVDLNAFGAILAQGAMLTPSVLKEPNAAQQQSHVDAVLAALQVLSGGPSSPCIGGSGIYSKPSTVFGSAPNATLMKAGANNNKSGGKNARGKAAGNSAAQLTQAATSKAAQGQRHSGTATTATAGFSVSTREDSQTKRTSRPRSEWYDVVQIPHSELPIIFIHQLPETDRADDDASGQLNHALQIIADELDRECVGHEMVVVLAVRDARALTSLTTCSSNIDTRLVVQFVDSPHSVGSRESVVRTGNRGRLGASSKRTPAAVVLDNNGAAVPPAPAANSFEAWIDRQQRERRLAVVDGPARAANAPGPICIRAAVDEVSDEKNEPLAAWVECCLQRVLPTLGHVASGIADYGEIVSSKPIIQYSVFPVLASTEAPEDASPAAPCSALGADGTGGNPLISSCSMSNYDLRRQKSQNTIQTAQSTGAPSTAAAATPTATKLDTTKRSSRISGASGKCEEVMQSTLFPHAEESRSEMRWSEYLRKRKVRGCFTCISAARALAAQVAVTMARRHQDTISHLDEVEERPLAFGGGGGGGGGGGAEKGDEGGDKKNDSKMENEGGSECVERNETKDHGVKDASHPLFASKIVPLTSHLYKAPAGSFAICRTLRDYVSCSASLTPNGSFYSFNGAVDPTESALDVQLISLAPSCTPTRVTSAADEANSKNGVKGVASPVFKSAKELKDKKVDRLNAQPLPRDIFWITQQFVKKGLGTYAFSPAETGTDVISVFSDRADGFSGSFEGDRLRTAKRMRELLEEPFSGLFIEEEEAAADQQILSLVEETLAREFVQSTKAGSAVSRTTSASEEMEAGILGNTALAEASLISPLHSGILGDMSLSDVKPLEDRFQRSVERSLTTREQQHILQQMFLERSVAAVHMTGTVDRDGCSTIASFLTTNLRPIEEYVTKIASMRRMYEFQSRFGAHMCRLLRRVIPDVMEMLELTSASPNSAVDTNPPKRVAAVMSAGVPTPPERRMHRLWCYLVSGIPSVDEFAELAATEKQRIEGGANAGAENGGDCAGTSTVAAAQTVPDSTCRPNYPIDDFIRRQLLQRLRDSRQFLFPTTRPEDGTAAPSGAQTVLEGRHALYPYCNAIVEVITTDRGRTCRYVKASELCCALHYSIPPPPAPLTSSAQQMTPSTAAPGTSLPIASAQVATSNENGNGTDAGSPSAVPSRPFPRDESIYLSVSFDDGVLLTCTRRLHIVTRPSSEEKAAAVSAKASSPALRNSTSRGGGRQRRGGPAASRGAAGQGADEENASSRRTASRRRGRGRLGNADGTSAGMAAAGAVGRADDKRWTFPVAADGSVLLWPGAEQGRNATRPAPASSPQGRVDYDVTLSAGGITLHVEERGEIVWLSRHEACTYPAPKALCCVHAMEGSNTRMRTSMEVEVRRAIVQRSGTVHRYFQSGSSQTLYANGSVLTRFPCFHSLPMTSQKVSSVCETLVMVSGECFAREVNVSDEKYETPKFQRLATTVKISDAYDPLNHCQIFSRADGVTTVRYLSRHKNGSSLTSHPGSVSPTDSSLSTEENARVVLHADGTSITTLAGGDVWHLTTRKKESTAHTQTEHHDEHGGTSEEGNEMEHVPSPLQPLISQIATVSAACGGHLRLCVEAPTLPRLFLCAEQTQISKDSSVENSPVFNVRKSLSPTDSKPTVASAEHKSSLYAGKSGCKSLFVNGVVHSVVPVRPLDTTNSQVIDLEDSTRDVQRAGFYVAFADGSVLCRRVVLRGTRPTPFLETLLTRTTETSVRVIHDSGIVVVEPADAVRRNASALSSLAIGEGFPMFDLSLGGLRLVDHEHHVTEVSDLYSPGAVRAAVVPTSLEALLRELVAPSYTPHRVPRARQALLDAEKAECEAQYLRDRSMGICPPLVRRLREFAEGFIIAHRLLNADVMLRGVHGVEGSRAMHVGGPFTLSAAATACWGAADPARLVSHLAKTLGTGNQKPSAELFTGKAGGMQDTARVAESQASQTVPFDGIPTLDQRNAQTALSCGIDPLFFSELEGGLAVQYLHERDVDDCLCAMDGDPLPVYLTRSVAAGEPGVQQWTLFRVATTAAAPHSSALRRRPNGSASMWSTIRTGAENGGHAGAMVCAVAGGSVLSEAVRREERLSAFAGFGDPVLTCAWLPPALRPPRRHLDARISRATPVWPSGISHLVAGGHSLIDLDESSETCHSYSPETYERLRVFLRFAEVAWEGKQVVLWGEMQRFQKLASLVSYQRAVQQLSQRVEEETEV